MLDNNTEHWNFYTLIGNFYKIQRLSVTFINWNSSYISFPAIFFKSKPMPYKTNECKQERGLWWFYHCNLDYAFLITLHKQLNFSGPICHACSYYHSSPSFSLAGTSMTRGLSMMRAVRVPFSTMPMIHAWYPSCFSMSLQNAAACSRGSAISKPPETQHNHKSD